MALEGGEWSAARPGRTLPPGKTRYPLYRRLGGPQGQSGRAEDLAPPGFDPRTIQSIVSHYTDWATWPAVLFFIMPKNAPRKIHINCQDITPTYFSENTPSSVSPKTQCSNILTLYLYLLWWYYKRKNESKMHGMKTLKSVHYIKSTDYLQLYPKNVT